MRLKTEKPIRLNGDGTAVKSIDGKTTIRSTGEIRTRKDGTRFRMISIAVNDSEREAAYFVPRTPDESAELLWGPKDSRFAVVRCAEDGTEKYVVLDLARNWWLWEARDKSAH